jgi:hypothetical protein
VETRKKKCFNFRVIERKKKKAEKTMVEPSRKLK